jgi:SpoVK/Ycf46/Vps4 family AAA+-type ATPase
MVLDYQHIIRNAGAYRALKNAFSSLKDLGSMLVLVAPAWQLPVELQHDLPIMQFDLPTREQLQMALHTVAESASITLNGDTDKLLDAAAGLSLQEAENAFALSLIKDRKLLPATVESEKMKLVKSSGYLEVHTPMPESSIGGLSELRSYLKTEVVPNRHDDLLRVKGLVLIGIPGTGKSLAAKVAGSITQWPVIRLDVSALKGSLVGQTEANTRNALRLVEAIAPCVLWIDEIEKGLGGHASSAQSDGGTTLGMVGILLIWLQEHNAPILTIATCNDYSKLPTELTRAGRIDERFFVDLPTNTERYEISQVHMAKYSGSVHPYLCDEISTMTKGYTGAEIEQLIKSAARRTKRNITLESLKQSAQEIKPISKTKEQEIAALRDWAKGNIRFANTPEVKATETRNIDI